MKLTAVFPLIILCLSGCVADRFAKDLFVQKLYLPYTAEADFIISDGEKNTEGKAVIVKSDITTVTFTEPSSYNGISVKSDAAGKEDVFSFELSGIPATVPKSLAGDLSLMFSLFTDVIPQKIDSLGKDAFRLSENVNSDGNELCEVFFAQNGTSYTLSYDANNGTPYSFDVGNDETSINILLSNFNQTIN